MAVLRSLVTTLGLNAAQFRSELKRSRDDFTSFGGSIVTGAKAVAGGVQATIAQIFSLRSALIALGSGAALAGIKAAYIDKRTRQQAHNKYGNGNNKQRSGNEIQHLILPPNVFFGVP